MGTAIKHPVPDRVKPSFVIFDIWALLRSGLSRLSTMHERDRQTRENTERLHRYQQAKSLSAMSPKTHSTVDKTRSFHMLKESYPLPHILPSRGRLP